MLAKYFIVGCHITMPFIIIIMAVIIDWILYKGSAYKYMNSCPYTCPAEYTVKNEGVVATV